MLITARIILVKIGKRMLKIIAASFSLIDSTIILAEEYRARYSQNTRPSGLFCFLNTKISITKIRTHSADSYKKAG